jgi:hypothetical protein
MQAVADAVNLLANRLMARYTMKLQSVLDRRNSRRSAAVPPERIGRIAPTRTTGINLRVAPRRRTREAPRGGTRHELATTEVHRKTRLPMGSFIQ